MQLGFKVNSVAKQCNEIHLKMAVAGMIKLPEKSNPIIQERRRTLSQITRLLQL